MKLMSFFYTDAKGRRSNRQVLVVSEPTDKLSAIDVSESEAEDIGEFVALYEQALSSFQLEVTALKEQFELQHNFRQFVASRIEDPISEML